MSNNNKKGLIKRVLTLPFAPVAIAGKSFAETTASLKSLITKTRVKATKQTEDRSKQRELFLKGLSRNRDLYSDIEDVPDEEWDRLAKLRRRLNISGIVFAIFGAFFLGFAFYSLFQGAWLSTVTSVLFAFINAISSNKNLFRAWQISERRLGTMKEFWDSQGIK